MSYISGEDKLPFFPALHAEPGVADDFLPVVACLHDHFPVHHTDPQVSKGIQDSSYRHLTSALTANRLTLFRTLVACHNWFDLQMSAVEALS